MTYVTFIFATSSKKGPRHKWTIYISTNHTKIRNICLSAILKFVLLFLLFLNVNQFCRVLEKILTMFKKKYIYIYIYIYISQKGTAFVFSNICLNQTIPERVINQYTHFNILKRDAFVTDGLQELMLCIMSFIDVKSEDIIQRPTIQWFFNKFIHHKLKNPINYPRKTKRSVISIQQQKRKMSEKRQKIGYVIEFVKLLLYLFIIHENFTLIHWKIHSISFLVHIFHISWPIKVFQPNKFKFISDFFSLFLAFLNIFFEIAENWNAVLCIIFVTIIFFSLFVCDR